MHLTVSPLLFGRVSFKVREEGLFLGEAESLPLETLHHDNAARCRGAQELGTRVVGDKQ